MPLHLLFSLVPKYVHRYAKILTSMLVSTVYHRELEYKLGEFERKQDLQNMLLYDNIV